MRKLIMIIALWSSLGFTSETTSLEYSIGISHGVGFSQTMHRVNYLTNVSEVGIRTGFLVGLIFAERFETFDPYGKVTAEDFGFGFGVNLDVGDRNNYFSMFATFDYMFPSYSYDDFNQENWESSNDGEYISGMEEAMYFQLNPGVKFNIGLIDDEDTKMAIFTQVGMIMPITFISDIYPNPGEEIHMQIGGGVKFDF